MREILVSGSTAYDIYMHYSGKFSQELQKQGLNMSLVSNHYEKNHGGTGANISYNLALLGENPILLSSVGEDYSFAGIMEDKVNLKYIHRENSLSTANSIIISDDDDNRMTFFHPGAMQLASHSKVGYVREDIILSIVSANNPATMLEHIDAIHEKGIKILADPSQQITALSQDKLVHMIQKSDYLIANQYEFNELQEKLGMTKDEIQTYFQWIIVTKGEKGLDIYSNRDVLHIQAIDINTEDIIDTTGAGDALRAGILFALAQGYDIQVGCQLGTILASYCIQAPGSQYHHFNLGQVMEDMKLHFGVEIDLYSRRKY